MKKYFSIICFILLFTVIVSSCSSKIEKEENAHKFYMMAVNAYAKQDFSDALELAGQALKANRNFYQAELLKVKILYFSAKDQEAEKSIFKLVKKHPGFTEARIWQIRILIQNKKYDLAEALIKQELSFNQTDWRIFNLYALLAERKENFNQRLSMNKQAEATLTEGSKVFIDLASIWISLGLRERALDYLEKAKVLSLNSENIEETIKHLKNGDDIL